MKISISTDYDYFKIQKIIRLWNEPTYKRFATKPYHYFQWNLYRIMIYVAVLYVDFLNVDNYG